MIFKLNLDIDGSGAWYKMALRWIPLDLSLSLTDD